MKYINLIHNPGAGKGEYGASELRKLLKLNRYECRYFSTKENNWKEFDNHADLLVMAGGDGTVRKVAAEVLKRKLRNNPGLLALLPLGTANNIARALGVEKDLKKAIRLWKNSRVAGFDVGRLLNLPKHKFFLEGFGFGLFPAMMSQMERITKKGGKSRGKNMKTALEMLHTIAGSYKARSCRIEIDGKDYSGDYLLAEVMNIPSIGPNLCISPESDPGDGVFEVVLVEEGDRQNFMDYLRSRMERDSCAYDLRVIKGRRIRISSELPHAHCDDKVVPSYSNKKVSIHLKKNLLNFLVP